MKTVIAALTTCAIALSIASAASAAPASGATATPYSISVGGYFPTNSAAKTNGGTTQLTVDGNYVFMHDATADTPIDLSVYADYMGGSKNGLKIHTGGIGVAASTSLGAGTLGGGISPYVGAGLGVYRNTSTGLGGKVFAGVNFASNLYGEAAYHFLPKGQSVDPSGFSLSIGARF